MTNAKGAGEIAGWFVPVAFIITTSACGIGISAETDQQFTRVLRRFTGGRELRQRSLANTGTGF